jgi:RimJ/RimL family protein N-acetyltransferase
MSRTPPPPLFETPRLLVRTWTEEDAEDAYRIWGNPEVMRFVDNGETLEDVEKARCVLGRAMVAQDALGICLWPVTEKATAQVVGACGFHRHGDGPQLELELGYHFVPEAWGRGFASEAVRACLRHAFEVLGATRVVAMVHPENGASSRVLEKTGFARIGEDQGEDLYELRPASSSR